jgi:hypothetical protein
LNAWCKQFEELHKQLEVAWTGVRNIMKV